MKRLSLILVTALVAATVPTHAMDSYKESLLRTLGSLGLASVCTYWLYDTVSIQNAESKKFQKAYNKANEQMAKLMTKEQKKRLNNNPKRINSFLDQEIGNVALGKNEALAAKLDQKTLQALKWSPNYSSVLVSALGTLVFGDAGVYTLYELATHR